MKIGIVGAGIFGVTAAITLRSRGHRVWLLDPGPLPHPLAESTDISKVVRLDYGADDAYTALMESALEGWRRWNAGWSEPLYHETGVTFLSRAPLTRGGFEYESMLRLTARGHAVERLDANAIRARFPAWNADVYVDGYYNPVGGYVESGKVVARLVREAQEIGVDLHAGSAFAALASRDSCISGVHTVSGELLSADGVVIAAGAWTPHALPFLREHLRTVGQPVFHLRPSDARPYRAERFPVFGADIARTGYYGFSANAEGIVKVANHGVGRAMHPESPARAVVPEEESALRAFLAITFPGLRDAPIVSTRVCVYCDSWDEHFWIAPDPDRKGLVVAAGGSGHGFKFAPVLGDLIADATLGESNPALAKFRWRPEVRSTRGEEAARHRV